MLAALGVGLDRRVAAHRDGGAVHRDVQLHGQLDRGGSDGARRADRAGVGDERAVWLDLRRHDPRPAHDGLPWRRARPRRRARDHVLDHRDRRRALGRARRRLAACELRERDRVALRRRRRYRRYVPAERDHRERELGVEACHVPFGTFFFALLAWRRESVAWPKSCRRPNLSATAATRCAARAALA